jgi:peptide methionine sulfoxide reductase MsrA
VDRLKLALQVAVSALPNTMSCCDSKVQRNFLSQNFRIGVCEKFNGTIVTEITKSSTFYPAEKYHQKYNEKMKKQYGIG